MNFSLNEDPIFVEKHAVIHRLINCSQFGSQLQDHHWLNFPAEHLLLHAFLAEIHLDEHALYGGIDLNEGAQHRIDLRMLHNTGHQEGLNTALTLALTKIHELHHEELNSNTGLTQGERDARDADYHSDPIVGETDLKARLQQVAQEASSRTPFSAQAYGEALVGLLHLGGHVSIAAKPSGPSPGGYDYEEQNIHTTAIDPLLSTLNTSRIHAMIQEKAGILHNYWHQQTGCPSNPAPQDSCYAAHQALHGAMQEFLDAASQAANASDQGGPRIGQ